jgi:hypothetical protein
MQQLPLIDCTDFSQMENWKHQKNPEIWLRLTTSQRMRLVGIAGTVEPSLWWKRLLPVEVFTPFCPKPLLYRQFPCD